MLFEVMECIVDDEMGITATVFESIHRGTSEALTWPELRLCGELEMPLLCGYLGVRLLISYIGRNDAVLKDEHCFYETSDISRAL